MSFSCDRFYPKVLVSINMHFEPAPVFNMLNMKERV